ncbi:hypothetical protein LOTGIDRAFT_174327 [Lottia gigantea]|uniref:CCHC-type domain-containing protein n=1 Tax=Lottia gigantea TaxID=225164 RepID=V4AX61_LOTGI|nr:hypothetical protein LOTGIDRAFT_174327 [Lottia gigantea]ESO98151.1 hypothetical protein LOTGIDRAFT_174327 [Lottia gigantea]
MSACGESGHIRRNCIHPYCDDCDQIKVRCSSQPKAVWDVGVTDVPSDVIAVDHSYVVDIDVLRSETVEDKCESCTDDVNGEELKELDLNATCNELGDDENQFTDDGEVMEMTAGIGFDEGRYSVFKSEASAAGKKSKDFGSRSQITLRSGKIQLKRKGKARKERQEKFKVVSERLKHAK